MTLQIEVPSDLSYNEYKIKKSNGKYRTITEPNPELKRIQKDILLEMGKVSPHNSAHGFVKNRSIATNASIHVGKEFVLNIDIKNFFPSVDAKMVSEVFKRHYGVEDTGDLLQVVMLNGGLPQGSPCSPYIANMALYQFDEELSDYFSSLNISYSRYADDITVSGSNFDNSIIDYIYEKIESMGFLVSKDKTKLQKRSGRQVVTGLVVNDKVNIDRKTRRRIRAMYHNYDTLCERERDYLSGMKGLSSMIR